MKTVGSDVHIRIETDDDYDGIDALVVAAFKDSRLSIFVRAIRDSSNYVPRYAFVAEQRDRVIGHVMLSYVTLRDAGIDHRVLHFRH